MFSKSSLCTKLCSAACCTAPWTRLLQSYMAHLVGAIVPHKALQQGAYLLQPKSLCWQPPLVSTRNASLKSAMHTTPPLKTHKRESQSPSCINCWMGSYVASLWPLLARWCLRFAPQVGVLNMSEASAKLRLQALGVIADLALVTSERAAVLAAFRQVGERFEKLLDDRLAGAAQFGTGLGRYHELTTITLFRLCDYSLSVRRSLRADGVHVSCFRLHRRPICSSSCHTMSSLPCRLLWASCA